MDWNKKNLLVVGDYFYHKLKSSIEEVISQLSDEQKTSLKVSSFNSDLINLNLSSWINFLKENNCEQYNREDFWVIFSRMRQSGVVVPIYRTRDNANIEEPIKLILCPEDFAEKILKLESFNYESTRI